MSQTTPPAGSSTRGASRYDDTLALNDIHAVITSPTLTDAAMDALQAITQIVVRTGRNPYPSRIMSATVEDGPHGIPVACIDAEGTIITIGQDPAGPGIRIDVTPRDPADEAALVIAVSDRIVNRALLPGLRPARPESGGQP